MKGKKKLINFLEGIFISFVSFKLFNGLQD